jgi:ferredoxin
VTDLAPAIRDAARRLLTDGLVDVVIGFEAGTLPLRSSPCFVRDAAEVKRLVWNMSCENNLAKYLPRRGERVGVIAKGCDTRSIVGLLKEGQIKRERLHIIGVPCRGVVDRRRIESELAGREAIDVLEEEGEVLLRGDGFEIALEKERYLHASCRACRSRNPVIYDTLIGDLVAEDVAADEYAAVREFEAKPAGERWRFFAAQASRCIRCYACRNVCPLCYCAECFVDSTQPRWLSPSTDATDALVFQIMRVMHTAGRCVDCGACERACPVGLDLRLLTKKVEKDVEELFHYKAGLDVREPMPLSTFSPDDPGDFIR